MWIILTIIFGALSFILLMSNSKKNDEIAGLKYTIVLLSDADLEKALNEYERFKK